jgi:hypothetical protein
MEPYPNPISRPDTPQEQTVREPIGALIDLRVGKPLTPTYQRHLVRKSAGALLKGVMNQEHG